MSFTEPEIGARIHSLKKRFEEMDLNPERAPDQNEDVLKEAEFQERWFSMRMAIISNLLMTMETALDQISICFEVSRAMFFYQEDIIHNPEFWAEEKGTNQTLCSNNFKTAIMDMNEVGGRLDREVGALQGQSEAHQDVVLKVLSSVEVYQSLIGRFHEYVGMVTEAEDRMRKGIPLYDVDQKPELGRHTPETYIKKLHMASARNAEAALKINVDLAESLFAAFNDKEGNGRSVAEGCSVESALALILNRFEVLEDVRDNRYGFTQIRFG